MLLSPNDTTMSINPVTPFNPTLNTYLSYDAEKDSVELEYEYGELYINVTKPASDFAEWAVHESLVEDHNQGTVTYEYTSPDGEDCERQTIELSEFIDQLPAETQRKYIELDPAFNMIQELIKAQ